MGDSLLTDSELLRLSIGGDRAAFAGLLDRYTPALTRYAWALMPSWDDAQDVVQETFLTAWKKLPSIRIVNTSVLPWLLVVCRNHSLNALRRNQRDQTVPLHTDVAGDERGTAAAEELRFVLDEISNLDEADRRLCQLCLIDGVSYKDAAKLVGSSPATARKRIERIRIKLRKAVMHGEY